jgi:hypothetical protein
MMIRRNGVDAEAGTLLNNSLKLSPTPTARHRPRSAGRGSAVRVWCLVFAYLMLHKF